MKKALLATLLLLSAHTFAQTWVQVPDVNFQAFLTANYPAGAFMTSGSDFFVDADFPDIQAEDTLMISSLAIASLEGLQAFDSLVSLACNDNQLTQLPTLPVNLTILDCSTNQLSSLPTLPESLIYLYCSDNELTVLPTLPNTLIALACGSNQLTTLPVLPNSLVVLDIARNQFVTVPDLLIDLQVLICSNNPLTSLPVLPASLTSLICDSIQITELPSLPMQLTGLNCSNNSLTVLPDLPATLQQLTCLNNQLTTLPELPGALTYLSCGDNQLTSLPALPGSLNVLICGLNQLTSLPDLPGSLTQLFCPENQLTSVPDLPGSLVQLNCTNNNISCYNEFPQSLQDITIVGNPFSCLPNYLPAMPQYLLVYPLCNENDPVNNPNGCESASGIQGLVFKDENNDCVPTAQTLSYVPMSVHDSDNNLIVSSTSLVNGNYYFAAGPGDYSLNVDVTNLNSSLEVTCPVNNLSSATVSASNPVVSAGDFGLKCIGFDLGVQSIVPFGAYFPGETHSLEILAGDLTAQCNAFCAAGISGEVTIDISGPGTVTFGGSPSSVSGNSAIYSIADFGVPGSNLFMASVLTDTTGSAGEQFCVSVTVSANSAGDLNAANNTYNYCYAIVNSHDPNIKETYPEMIAPNSTEELTYTIHFQNTGNAPAMNIRLSDVLDESLDLSTLKIVNASADYTYSLNTESRLLSIRFPNIMLADSASDPVGSIGFVQYRIHPIAGLTDGTIIENTASIYFDYNDPIVTNTSENLVSEELGVYENNVNDAKLYPNPAKNNVTFESEEVIDQLEFYSLNGTKVLIVKPELKKAQVDISALQNGVYIVKVQSLSGVVNKRLVVSQ